MTILEEIHPVFSIVSVTVYTNSTIFQNGVNFDDNIANAENYDGTRYFGLKYNEYAGFIDQSGFIVKLLMLLLP